MKTEKITWDWNSLESIQKAERKQTKLVNKGYNYVKTVSLGLDKEQMIYQK